RRTGSACARSRRPCRRTSGSRSAARAILREARRGRAAGALGAPCATRSRPPRRSRRARAAEAPSPPGTGEPGCDSQTRMPAGDEKALDEILSFLYRRHPWHGIAIGDDAPRRVTAFIEIVPTDTVKYELDKATGHLKIDRPQKFSNVYPTLYGLIPQTYCGEA